MRGEKFLGEGWRNSSCSCWVRGGRPLALSPPFDLMWKGLGKAGKFSVNALGRVSGVHRRFPQFEK